MGWQTAFFRKRVGEFMHAAPGAVTPDQLVRDAVGSLTASSGKSVVVVDANRRIVGLVTDWDVTSKVALVPGALDKPVAGMMTTPVETARADDPLYFAVATMRRNRQRHLPVVGGDGRLVGMLDLVDALTHISGTMMDHIERLSRLGSTSQLKKSKIAQIDLAEALLADRVPTPEIQALLSETNHELTRRAVDRCLHRMAEEGWGPPPVPFCMIIMGSGGRGESLLTPDQDNGFVLDDYPDAHHTRIDAFFTELAGRVTEMLDRIGFPLCKGHCMATNPVWRKTRSQWAAQIRLWGRTRSTVAVRLSDIFFDFAPVYGELSFGRELRGVVTDFARKSPAFLSQMYSEEADHDVALGLFGRLRTEHEPDVKGQINLKHAGTLPLVEAVRLMALKHGVPETATLARIRVLAERGLLNEDEEDYLAGAYRHVTRLLLRRQIELARSGALPSNHVDPADLSKRERAMLVDSLHAIDGFRRRLRGEFTGDIF